MEEVWREGGRERRIREGGRDGVQGVGRKDVQDRELGRGLGRGWRDGGVSE